MVLAGAFVFTSGKLLVAGALMEASAALVETSAALGTLLMLELVDCVSVELLGEF